MHSNGKCPFWLKFVAFGGITFLHFPIVVIAAYAFNTEESAFSFPLQGFTFKWFSAAFARQDVIDAILLSLKVASIATAAAIVLGTMAAAALYRRSFFGKETITLIFILPIALPGIITGIALLSAFRMAGWDLNFWTIVAGHTTFCVVVIYNNVIARFRRTSQNLIEASMDLGADGIQTFFHIVLPNIATALLAGGVLAFALSFDEIIVTTFTAGPGTHSAHLAPQPTLQAPRCTNHQCCRPGGYGGYFGAYSIRLLYYPRERINRRQRQIILHPGVIPELTEDRRLLNKT